MARIKKQCIDLEARYARNSYKLGNAVVVLSVMCAMLLCVVASVGTKNSVLNNRLDNSYRKSLFEATENLDNIELKLSKLAVCGDEAYAAVLASEIWRQCDNTATNLAQLPLQQDSVGSIESYVNTLGDYCFSLSKRLVRGEQISNEEREDLQNMQRRSSEAAQDLGALASNPRSINQSANNKRLKKGQIPFSRSFDEMKAKSVQYPAITYSGDFSSAAQKPYAYLSGLEQLSAEQATKQVRAMLQDLDYQSITYLGEAGGDLATYEFMATKQNGTQGYAQLTKQGGKLLMLNSTKRAGFPVVDTDTAVELAQAFAKKIGFKNVACVRHTESDDTAFVTLAHFEGKVAVYPDSIIVKIALDSGEVSGFESEGYLKNHTVRDLGAPQVTLATARDKLSKNLAITGNRLVVVSVGNAEVLAYEFDCLQNHQQFFIYIDANSGNTVDIQRVCWCGGEKRVK